MSGRHALLIGNSVFRHGELARLSAPANDVRDLAALLEDPEIGGFEVVLKLDVSLVDGRKAIRHLFDNRVPDDLVLLYYSGHGLLDVNGRFYLAMTETDPDYPDSGSIDEKWLRDVIDESRSERQVAILDCCHSGAIIPSELTRRDAPTGPILTEKTFDPTGHGRFIMAATTATTSAFEQEGRSLYTRHLVEGLNGGAAAPEKDQVTVFDLHAFVKRRVAETAPASMRPQLWKDASLNPAAEHLAIARNPRPRPKLAETLVKDLWSDVPRDVELAIYRLKELASSDGALAEDARRVLRERLKAGDTLSYTLGARIAEFIDPPPSAALAAAMQVATETEAKLANVLAERNRLEAKLHAERAARDMELKAAQESAAVDAIAWSAERETLTAERDARDRDLKAEQERAAAEATTWETEREKLVAERDALTSERDADRAAAQDASPGDVVELGAALGRSRAAVLRTQLLAVFVAVGGGIVVAVGTNIGWIRSQFPAAKLISACEACPEMIKIDGGSFEMGSPSTEAGRFEDEGPQQPITVADFALARTEVTFDQWDACATDGFCTANPSPGDNGWGRGARPVINVSWEDANAFIAWLNDMSGDSSYHLPTEAEWEYAARAGAGAAYPWGDDWNAALANGADGGPGQTTVVGTYPANGFGLHDMIGNVREWVEDCWRGSLADQPPDGSAVVSGNGADCVRRVVRGGSWGSEPRFLRSASHSGVRRGGRGEYIGFRPARTLTP